MLKHTVGLLMSRWRSLIPLIILTHILSSCRGACKPDKVSVGTKCKVKSKAVFSLLMHTHGWQGPIFPWILCLVDCKWLLQAPYAAVSCHLRCFCVSLLASRCFCRRVCIISRFSAIAVSPVQMSRTPKCLKALGAYVYTVELHPMAKTANKKSEVVEVNHKEPVLECNGESEDTGNAYWRSYLAHPGCFCLTNLAQRQFAGCYTSRYTR